MCIYNQTYMYVYIHIYLHIYIWYILYIYLCLGLPESLGVSCLGWNGIKLRDIPSFGWLLKNRDWDPISASKRCGYACFKADFFGGGKKNGTKLQKHIANIYSYIHASIWQLRNAAGGHFSPEALQSSFSNYASLAVYTRFAQAACPLPFAGFAVHWAKRKDSKLAIRGFGDASCFTTL